MRTAPTNWDRVNAALVRTGQEIILASASPRRCDLLRQVGLPFKVVVAAVPEPHGQHLTARELALQNAHRKALTVARRHPEALVIGADTVVCLGTHVFGKPRDMAEAERMLGHLQGREHDVITAICILHLAARRQRLLAATTRVVFQPLSKERIRRYLAAVDPLDKAGAYAIQERGEWIVAEVDGSYSNVVGLPVEMLGRELRAWFDKTAGTCRRRRVPS